MKQIIIGILLLFSFGYSLISDAECAGKVVYGQVETVLLANKKVLLEAKLDTGAAMASLSAKNIKKVTRGKQTWVQFSLQQSDTSAPILFQARLVRVIKILNRVGETKDAAPHSERPVINLAVCIGEEKHIIHVNLVDRKNFSFAFLLGVNAIKKFNAIVDVSKRNLMQEPRCSY
jgi:hypothetical protein